MLDQVSLDQFYGRWQLLSPLSSLFLVRLLSTTGHSVALPFCHTKMLVFVVGKYEDLVRLTRLTLIEPISGAPGSGKGTLCRKLCTSYGYAHLSVGDHLRELVNSKSEVLGDDMMHRIERCELLHVDDLLPILQTAIRRLETDGAGVILMDGFPRRIEQLKVKGGDTLRPHLVLFFDCPRDIAEKRYLTRALPGRDSDLKVFTRRYEEFARMNPPLVQEYAESGILLTVILRQRFGRRSLTPRQVDTSTDTDVSYEILQQALRRVGRGLCT